MKTAIAITGAGIEAIEVRNADILQAKTGEALVHLTSATLNYRDFAFAGGRLPGMTKQPDYVPLSCAAGQIVALGQGVSCMKEGDQVQPLFALGWFERLQPTMDMLGGIAVGVARVVDHVYHLDRIKAAFRHLESGKFFGKIGVNLL